ncbi:MAG TPA: histidine phosphatase family protein [Phycisphaerales bacterium]|nr:histidine phosphatase family protein [Phycisphaerales bacterium]HCD33651.1 histidine phosphatase family protein [Phycisphaerales bacterium]|tara:strand:- start:1455 stop:2144 length:690 start_codon:yes stop_codon:yes gene_type:complete
MRLYILRHGDPNYELDALTPRGIPEAKALANYMAHEKIDDIYASPRGRAQETASFTARLMNKSVTTEPWTTELSAPCNHGYCEWDTHGDEIRNDDFLSDLNAYDKIPTMDPQWLESVHTTIRKDSDEYLARLGYVRQNGAYRVEQPNDKRIAMFCHGGFGSAWVATLLEIPLPLMWSGFFMHTTSVTCILFDERKPGIAVPRCLYYGALPHLYHEGIEPSQSGIKANYE